MDYFQRDILGMIASTPVAVTGIIEMSHFSKPTFLCKSMPGLNSKIHLSA